MERTHISVRLEKGRTLPLTASIPEGRIFIPEEDPLFSQAAPGEIWNVELGEEAKTRLWRAKLVARSNRVELRGLLEDGHRLVQIANRHVGQDTPAILKLALQTLPLTFEVAFDHEDRKGIFGLFNGVAIRPDGRRGADAPQRGDHCRVNPFASGRQGIYVRVVGRCEPTPGNHVDCTGRCGDQPFSAKHTARSERNGRPGITAARAQGLPEPAEVCFDHEDERGLYALWNSHILRPDRNWKGGGPRKGQRVRVRFITIIRASIAFVLPLGH